jgi:UDP-2-acetamido-3-amino-2,3-dideoxy-glucuronate N-acetyltransferase
MKVDAGIFVHPTAEVSPDARLSPGCHIWNEAQIREGARLGRGCVLGKGVYVDADVEIGDNCRLQNRVSVYQGVILERGVFVGPHTCLINNKRPRVIRPDGVTLNWAWEVGPTLVRECASVGAGAVVCPSVTVGKWAMVGAGSVVVENVPNYGYVAGNPARLLGYICPCGHRLAWVNDGWRCTACGKRVDVSA